MGTDGQLSLPRAHELTSGHRIIVVEDDDDSRAAMAMVLALEGYSVLEASSAEEGLAEILAPSTSLAIVDIGLPGQDGFALIFQVRAAIGDRVPLIALTGRAEPEEHKKIMAAGFRKHLTKPVSLDGLRKAIRAVLDGTP
jgi:DNA-binding response OmpR family regulator